MPNPQCGFDHSLLADLAAIATAVVAVFWFSYSVYDRCRKRRKLEKYLSERLALYESKKEDCRHSVVHLVAKLGLTEDEILQASFRSKHISRYLQSDNDGIARGILFEYKKT